MAEVPVRRHLRRKPKPTVRPRTERFPAPHAVRQTRGARAHMEDYARLARIRGGEYVGVFDGHGGFEAAEVAARKLHQVFRDLMDDGVDADAALTAAFLLVDDDILETGTYAGTTATVAYKRGNDLLVANVGDSEAIMVTENGYKELTTAHNADNYFERNRVLKAGGEFTKGGLVYRTVETLAMTRSLGDRDFRRAGTIPDPDVRKYEIGPRDQYLVVASDGIWNFFDTKNEVANVVRNSASPDEAARELIAIAKKRFPSYADNITVAIVPVRRAGPSVVGIFDRRSGRTSFSHS